MKTFLGFMVVLGAFLVTYTATLHPQHLFRRNQVSSSWVITNYEHQKNKHTKWKEHSVLQTLISKKEEQQEIPEKYDTIEECSACTLAKTSENTPLFYNSISDNKKKRIISTNTQIYTYAQLTGIGMQQKIALQQLPKAIQGLPVAIREKISKNYSHLLKHSSTMCKQFSESSIGNTIIEGTLYAANATTSVGATLFCLLFF